MGTIIQWKRPSDLFPGDQVVMPRAPGIADIDCPPAFTIEEYGEFVPWDAWGGRFVWKVRVRHIDGSVEYRIWDRDDSVLAVRVVES